MPEMVKIVVFVPESHADAVREAMGSAGAGRIGNYTYCSFSVTGTGRFIPGEGAHPTVGRIGELASVREERVETLCARSCLDVVLAAIREVHPYEEPAVDVYQLIDRSS